MTDHERDVYMLLCMTGRSREATDYREECERARKEKIKKDFCATCKNKGDCERRNVDVTKCNLSTL